jgi:hypothetical protein
VWVLVHHLSSATVEYAVEVEQCTHCSQVRQSVGLVCSRYKDTWYCSKDYQKSTWSSHKTVCSDDDEQRKVLPTAMMCKGALA